MRVLAGEPVSPPPIWVMRQAGRYLPEYRELRAQKGGFLELCYDSDTAAEVTLQPIRRFGFDGAILFSDILVIPHAMGQDLWFETGEGPRLAPPPLQAERKSSRASDRRCISAFRATTTCWATGTRSPTGCSKSTTASTCRASSSNCRSSSRRSIRPCWCVRPPLDSTSAPS